MHVRTGEHMSLHSYFDGQCIGNIVVLNGFQLTSRLGEGSNVIKFVVMSTLRLRLVVSPAGDGGRLTCSQKRNVSARQVSRAPRGV